MDNSSIKETKTLSIIIPCFNEEVVIEETHRRLHDVLGTLSDLEIELIYIDDGSEDGTLGVLKNLQARDSCIRIVSFSRNFGHQIAISAGIENASGDAVVLIDADLQDPPELIPIFVDLWREGVEVAYGQREAREGEGAFKLWTAKTFYRIINRISNVPIPLDTGDFRLMDRKVVNTLLSMPERYRFVRGMVSWVGFRQECVRYKRAARFAGSTKYPLRKMVRFAADGILSFSMEPLRMAVWMGFTAAGLAFAGILYALVIRLMTNSWVQGWALLFIAILFMGGVQLVFLGVIGEYLGRVYGEVKRRPLYVVKERLGFKVDTTQATHEDRE